MSMIRLDKLAPGAVIRCACLGGVNDQYLSVRDMIMHLCDWDYRATGKFWDLTSPDVKEEVAFFCQQYRFPGKGQQEQTVISFPGAVKLAQLVTGANAKKNRPIIISAIKDCFNGDPSLIEEVEIVEEDRNDEPAPSDAHDSPVASGTRKRALDNTDLVLRTLEIKSRSLELFAKTTELYSKLCSPKTEMDEEARAVFKRSLLNWAKAPDQELVFSPAD